MITGNAAAHRYRDEHAASRAERSRARQVATRQVLPLMARISVVQELAFAKSLSGIQETFRAAARRLTHPDGATFVLREQDQCYYADEEAISRLWTGMRFPMDICISGWNKLQRRAP